MWGAWATELVLITMRDVGAHLPGGLNFTSSRHDVEGLPLPADYLATFVIFAPLSFIADSGPNASKLATVIGWGYVLATLLNAINPSQPLHKPTPPKPSTSAGA